MRKQTHLPEWQFTSVEGKAWEAWNRRALMVNAFGHIFALTILMIIVGIAAFN